MSEAARMASLADGEAQQQANAAADAGFLWNFWYPALRSEEIRGTKLATAMLLEVPLVLGRTSDAARLRCGMPALTGEFRSLMGDLTAKSSSAAITAGAST